MAAASVSFDGGRVNDAEALGSIWTDLGGGKCASEPDFVYQNTAAVSEKVGTSEAGVALDMVATVDYTTPKVWIAKHIATNSAALNNKGSTGGILEIGSGGRRSAYDRYYVVGGDTYPIKGGWLITPIDPNGGNQSARPGTAPTLTAIDYYGWAADFSATSKAENVAMDAVDWVEYGQGLTVIGGDGASDDATFEDFVTFDEGTSTNRYGIVSTIEGILYVTGFLNIGTATHTDFTDSGRVIVFPDAEFLDSPGFFGLGIDVTNASSVVDITQCVFQGRGSSAGNADTRPDYTVSGLTGLVTYTSCLFSVFRNFTAYDLMIVDECSFTDGLLIDQSLGTFTGCAFAGGTGGDGVAYMLVDDPELVEDCTFTFSDGHAMELAPTGAGPLSFDMSGNQFVGYGADATNDAAIYVNPVTSSADITLNIVGGGSAPTIREAAGYTGTFTLVLSPVEALVRVFDISTATVLVGARVLATAGSTGTLPYQDSVTISRVTTTASVAHTAHGLEDGDKVVIKGATQPEYNGVRTITNVTTNAYDYTVSGSPTTPATGTIISTAVILDGVTGGVGTVSDTKSFTVGQTLEGKAAFATTPGSLFKQGTFSGTINSTTGLTINISLVPDE